MANEMEQLDALEILIDTFYTAIANSLSHEHITFYWNVGRRTRLEKYQHIEADGRWLPREKIWLVDSSVRMDSHYFEKRITHANADEVIQQLKIQAKEWLESIRGEFNGRATESVHSAELVASPEEMG